MIIDKKMLESSLIKKILVDLIKDFFKRDDYKKPTNEEQLSSYLDDFKNPDRFVRLGIWSTPGFIFSRMHKALLLPYCRMHFDEIVEAVEVMLEKEKKMKPSYFSGYYLINDLYYLKEKGINKSKLKFKKILKQGIKDQIPLCLYLMRHDLNYSDKELDNCYGYIFNEYISYENPIMKYYFEDDLGHMKRKELLKHRFDIMTFLAREDLFNYQGENNEEV